MRETVANLREGWYGNIQNWDSFMKDNPDDYQRHRKEPVDCKKLFMSSIKMADEKIFPLCQGISGTIGSLIVDKSHQSCKEGLPIDMLISEVVQQLHDEDIIAK
jgi:hypothetical protein